MSKKSSRKRRRSKRKSEQTSHARFVARMEEKLLSHPDQTYSDELKIQASSDAISHRARRALVTSKARVESLLSVSQTVKRIKKVTTLDREQFFGVWDYIIVTLSLVSLLTMFMQLNRNTSPELVKLLHLFDWITCAVFFADFIIRLSLAPSKLAYLRWGWIDLISSIPALEQLRFGRIFRLVRILRAIRGAVASTKKVKLRDPFLSAVMIYFLCVFLGATSVLYLEAEVDGSNIKNARDAIWWAMVTVTTVGYGDFTPVTDEGRLLAVTLMSAGIGLFGVFSVQCTQYLLKRWQDDEVDKLEEIQTELSVVKTELISVQHTLNTLTEMMLLHYDQTRGLQEVSEEDSAVNPLPINQEGGRQADG